MSLFGKLRLAADDVTVIDVPDGFHVPPKTQWAFTPALNTLLPDDGISGNILTGTGLAPNLTLHHEVEDARFAIEPSEDYGEGLVFNFADFTGSFFSLAFALPQEGVLALGRQDLLRLVLRTQTAEPFQAYARLNLCHGPNTEQIVRMIEVGEGESFAEFDIFYTEFEQKRATSA